MRLGVLRSVGHNIADSLASGIGLMIGYCPADIFEEAAGSAESCIEVDFLNGTSSGVQVSEPLALAIARYTDALGDLCRRQGTSVSEFRELKARYWKDGIHKGFAVTVEDRNGRRSTDEYIGVPGKQVMLRDRNGALRPKRTVTRPNAEPTG